MECGLRVGRAIDDMAQDALDPHHRLGVAAADIADQAAPFRRAQHPAQRRQGSQRLRVERDLAHDRVALGDLAQWAAIGFDLMQQFGEFAGRQEVRPDHKAVALEGVAVGGGDQPGEAAAAHRGDPVRQPDPESMQAAFVEPAAADDPVALEGFAAGGELRRPQRHHRGAA